MLRVPWKTALAGRRTAAIVEHVPSLSNIVCSTICSCAWRKFPSVPYDSIVQRQLQHQHTYISSSTRLLTDRLVTEQVDLYPSLAEIAGIPVDKKQESIAGTSWAALLDNPDAEHKVAAFAQYPRCWPANVSHNPSAFTNMARCSGVSKLTFAYMGYSIRTREYRYTEWAAWDGARLAPLWNQSAGVEVSCCCCCCYCCHLQCSLPPVCRVLHLHVSTYLLLN
jgi:hypothetical protein